jgi:pseudaminic acid synthase
MTDKKRKSRQFSRSLYIAEDVKAGEIITERNIRSVRPGYGLHPKHLNDLLGSRFTHDLSKGDRLSYNDITK